MSHTDSDTVGGGTLNNSVKPQNACPVYVILIILVTFLLSAGCGNSTDNPIVSKIETADGYIIQLSSSVETLKSGEGAVITAVVFSPEGTLVPDNEKLNFASSEGVFFQLKPL